MYNSYFVGAMKMGNIVPRAFWASVLPLHHIGTLMSPLYPRLPVYAAPCLRGQCRLQQLYHGGDDDGMYCPERRTRTHTVCNSGAILIIIALLTLSDTIVLSTPTCLCGTFPDRKTSERQVSSINVLPIS